MHDQSPLLPLEHVSAANGRLAVVHRAEHRAQLSAGDRRARKTGLSDDQTAFFGDVTARLLPAVVAVGLGSHSCMVPVDMADVNRKKHAGRGGARGARRRTRPSRAPPRAPT